MTEYTHLPPPPPPPPIVDADDAPRPWWKKKWVIAVGALVLIGGLADSDDSSDGEAVAAADEAPSEPTADAEPPSAEAQPPATTLPTEAPPPPPAPGTYGSDPTLDRLQDRCAGGDGDACDDLYWDSPSGSAYEAFAESRQGTDNGLLSDADMGSIRELALEVTWGAMSVEEQVDVCLGFNTYGAEVSYEFFTTGWTDEPPTLAQFSDFFYSKC